MSIGGFYTHVDKISVGVINMLRSVAIEYATRGIRLNAIAPGIVDTAMGNRFADGHPTLSKQQVVQGFQPMARFGKPEEIATMALFLVSDESTFCTGACFCVDGGMTCD